MVAELSGITVSTSVPVGSSRNKTSRTIGCKNDFSCSSSSLSSACEGRDVEKPESSLSNRKRPRWLRAAGRQPIYSVRDVRENSGCPENSSSPSLRTVAGRGKTREYEISAVRTRVSKSDREGPPIYRRSSTGRSCDSEKIGLSDRRKTVEVVADEHELYSVVRKIPKQVLHEIATKLPILREEEIEDPREEVANKQLELHKWLKLASETKVVDVEESRMNAAGGFDATGNREREETAIDRKFEESWNSPGLSIPRGVVGMVGPFCRIYRDPNELREHMLKEEVQERGIDVGDAIDVAEDRKMANVYEDEDTTAVDSASESTFVGDSDGMIKTREYEMADDESLVIEQQQYRRRAKWRIVEEGTERECEVKKFDEKNDDKDEVRKSMKNREWSKGDDDEDDKRHLGHIGSKENYDLEIPPKYTSRKSDASNEPHDKDSLNETGSTTGGTVEGNHSGSPARGERSAGPNEPAAGSDRRPPIATTAPPRSLVSRILARARSPDDLLDHSEPYSELWIVLSNVYGELVVVLMMALCLAEVMDTPVPLLSLQSIYLMYLYVGSIAVIISIYLWVLVDSCGSLANGNSGVTDAELGGTSLTRFGSLKRAHISRARTAPTSFYIRVGALLFGLATLVFNGLEMAMHTMMQGAECLSDVVFVHPVLHGLFTFLQMHFLFVNSQVLVERFGLAARFGFTHLAATNIAVWARLVIWDSAQEWTYFVHLAQRGPETSSSPLTLRGFPGSLTRKTRDVLGRASSDDVIVNRYQPISDEQISQVVTLQECFNTNTLGQLWTSSMPFLYPFIVQFSLIAAAVTYVMGQNVGKNRYHHKQKYHSKDYSSHTRVSCDGTSKGLFLGILCMTAGIVVILIFLVVREDENFPPATLSWLTCGTLIGILTLSGLMTASGLVQVRQMSVVTRAPAVLDGILSNVALFGVQLYSVFTAVVCACSLATFDAEIGDADSQGRHAMLLAASILQLVQCFAQSTLMAEASKRSCITRFQMNAKPARQVITFLLFSNAVLWAFDTVVTQNWVSQELQLRFFGVLAWGVVSRICLPLVVFYRFHSCVLLLEAWNKCYRTPRGEHPLN